MDTPNIPIGLSYDDVLLVPQHSAILPGEANLASRVTESIPLNIPVISSAMDTVTEDRLAIALAREGGMGVIHRNCPIPEQAKMVARVKRSENIIITNPHTVRPDMSLEQLREQMGRNGISGFPVVDAADQLVGIVTQRDIWSQDGTKTIAEVMTPRDMLLTALIHLDQDIIFVGVVLDNRLA